MNNKIFKNKTFMITGGTGSFGSEMASKLLKLNIKKLIIFSRDEKKQFDMMNKLQSDKIEFVIGDVRDQKSIDSALSLGIDYVFHAAALKQVPSCEFFPQEAIKTNILGAENVMDSCIKYKVKKCVFLSTDKAVYPINSMGLSKALMEKLLISKSRKNTKTIFCGTRYGNVMGTRGSIIPLFVNQIKNNKKLTITNPNMTRFLMSLEESVELVLYAFANGKTGEILVHKAPAATIDNLFKAIQKIFNKKLSYKIIGVRNGEKFHETLISKEEMLRAKNQGKFYIIPPEYKEINYSKYFFKGTSNTKIFEEYNSSNTERLSPDQVIKVMKKSKHILKLL
jgi:UDP-N-acetylglucosamine 4,6-dehydratase/5-epimerase